MVSNLVVLNWDGLIYGAEKSSLPERNLADIEQMGARLEIAPFEAQVAADFG